jgi:hypothetical protein
MFRIGELVLFLLLIAIAMDTIIVYSKRNGIRANRVSGDRFSIGDLNKIIIRIKNQYGFQITTGIIDELPVQFMER